MSTDLLLNQELFTQSGREPEAYLTQISRVLIARGHLLATAESCTGGLIAAACTALPGSSAWFDRGFVTYSNEAKTDMLGVDSDLIAAHGAVSEPVVRAMAAGAQTYSRAQVTLAVTGVAGPSGGTLQKPVGTVWFGWKVQNLIRTECCRFHGDRSEIRAATVQHALSTLLTLL